MERALQRSQSLVLSSQTQNLWGWGWGASPGQQQLVARLGPGKQASGLWPWPPSTKLGHLENWEALLST